MLAYNETVVIWALCNDNVNVNKQYSQIRVSIFGLYTMEYKIMLVEPNKSCETLNKGFN